MYNRNNIIINLDFFNKHGIYKKSSVQVVTYVLGSYIACVGCLRFTFMCVYVRAICSLGK